MSTEKLNIKTGDADEQNVHVIEPLQFTTADRIYVQEMKYSCSNKKYVKLLKLVRF